MFSLKQNGKWKNDHQGKALHGHGKSGGDDNHEKQTS